MNITFVGNPYVESEVNVFSRGTMTDAKIAKLNNDTKKPAICSNWLNGIRNLVEKVRKDYNAMAVKLNLSATNSPREATVDGLKKLRVTNVVTINTSDFYGNSVKIDVVPRVEEQPKIPEEPKAVDPAMSLEPVINTPVTTRSDIHGRHEHTGPIPVDEVREAVRNDALPITSAMPSRAERNALANEMPKEEFKETKVITPAGDPDLIFNKLHNDGPNMDGNDVFKKLEEVKNERLKYQAEMEKITEQTKETIVNIADVKEKIANSERAKEEKAKQELAKEIALLEDTKQEVLEKTKYLTSLRQDLAEYEAKQAALNGNDDNFYDEYRSRGMAA